MILPDDFYSTYGTPIPKTYNISGDDVLIIPANTHRYLLAFMASTGNLSITPENDGQLTWDVPNFGAGALPLIFTHALHGALVNLGFRVHHIGVVGTFSILVCEGRMKVHKQKGGRIQNAKNK